MQTIPPTLRLFLHLSSKEPVFWTQYHGSYLKLQYCLAKKETASHKLTAMLANCLILDSFYDMRSAIMLSDSKVFWHVGFVVVGCSGLHISMSLPSRCTGAAHTSGRSGDALSRRRASKAQARQADKGPQWIWLSLERHPGLAWPIHQRGIALEVHLWKEHSATAGHMSSRLALLFFWKVLKTIFLYLYLR